MSYQSRTTISDVYSAYYRFQDEARLSGLIGPNAAYRGLSLVEGRPRWNEDWELRVTYYDEDGHLIVDTASQIPNRPEWLPADLTASRGTAYRRLNEATDKLRTKRTIGETSRRAALDEAATLLLDAVGVETYRTMITDGLTPVEALRTAVLLGRME